MESLTRTICSLEISFGYKVYAWKKVVPMMLKNRKPVEMNILLQAISHYKIFSVTLIIILV